MEGGGGELPSWGFAAEDAPYFAVDAADRATLIAGGAYGEVYEATLPGVRVAAKTLHMLRNPEGYGLDEEPAQLERVLGEFHREAEALASAQHPNVLRFFGVCYERDAGGAPPRLMPACDQVDGLPPVPSTPAARFRRQQGSRFLIP